MRRILTNPFYCGDLVNHQRERSRITKKQIKVPKEEQFIHKDAVPAIIPREIWDKVQEIIRINSEGKVKSQSNQTCHRYASLLKCGDCGSTFTVYYSRKNRHQKALKNGMNRRNSFDFSPPGRIYSTVHLTTSLCRYDILAKERNSLKGGSPWHKPIISAPHCQATFAA